MIHKDLLEKAKVDWEIWTISVRENYIDCAWSSLSKAMLRKNERCKTKETNLYSSETLERIKTEKFEQGKVM